MLSVVTEDAVQGVMGGGDSGVLGVKGVIGHLGRPKLRPESGAVAVGDTRGLVVVSVFTCRGLLNDLLRTICFSAATGEVPNPKRGELGGCGLARPGEPTGGTERGNW